MTVSHKDTLAIDNHINHSWTFANAAARTGAVYSSVDIGKDAMDLDTEKFFRVKSVSVGVATFIELGGVTDISGKEPTITAGTTSQYWRGDKSWQTLNKTAVGLSNVPNTDCTNASNLSSGTIDIARLPPSALERLYLYTGAQTAPENFGLTTGNVQTGDTVKVSNGGNASNGLMWIIKDDSLLNAAGGFEAYSVGAASSVPWSGITSKPTTISGYGITDFLSQVITGFVSGAGTVAATDTILQAFNKIVGNQIAISTVTQNSQSAAYTLVIGDSGKHIYHPVGDNNARTFTIPANSSVAFDIGTVITFVNMINTVTIAITTDTLTLSGAGTTGSRTLAANGIATALKVASTSWIISGTGLT